MAVRQQLSPFLWAVLPPVALSVLEVVLLRTTHVKDFVGERLLGLFQMLGWREQGVGSESTTIHISDIHLAGNLKEFYSSPELWLGVVAAGLLLAAAIWVRRYRDETT